MFVLIDFIVDVDAILNFRSLSEYFVNKFVHMKAVFFLGFGEADQRVQI